MKRHDYMILIYSKEDSDKYYAALNALAETKKLNEWDRVEGVTILKDCRIPNIYHGNDMAIIMERYNGNGNYSIKIMN